MPVSTPPTGDLVELLGPAHVLTEPGRLASYATDWTGRFHGLPSAVVRPSSAAEVAEVVRWCRQHGVGLVAQGGNTGLVGGGIAVDGGIVCSAERLRVAGEVDLLAQQTTVGAGVTLGELHRLAGPHALRYPVDFGAREQATAGGTVATNAGGVHVVRFGTTRRQVVGMEAVLGTGEVIAHLGGLEKDNTGYDLPGLLCGSEGTLGVVTGVRLRLVAEPAFRTAALVGFASVAAAVAATVVLRRSHELEAAELLLPPGLALVGSWLGAAVPLDPLPAAALLVEVASDDEPTLRLAEQLAACPGVTATAVAEEPGRRAGLWRLRHAHPQAIAARARPAKLDVAVSPARVAELVERLPGVVERVAPGAETWLFGHVADGNIHVNVTGCDPDDPRLEEAVLRLVVDLDGTISAEHGIGRLKRRWLDLCRSPAELGAFRAVKRALDPDGICNPGVLLGEGPSAAQAPAH